MSTLKIIKYFVITNFLFIFIGCSYNGTIPENTNLFKKTNPSLIENNIYYDESSINSAQNLIFTPPPLGEYNINYKNIVNNYSKKLLGRNFKRINDKNANIVVTSDAEIFFERKIRWSSYFKGELSLNFINKSTNKLIKKYYYEKNFSKENRTSTNLLAYSTMFTLFLISPITLPIIASNEGTDFENLISNFFRDGFKNIEREIQNDSSLYDPTSIATATSSKIISKPLVSKKTNECGVAPISSIGDISEIQQLFLNNKLQEIISSDFKIVPQKKFEKAMEVAFEELEYNECTEDQCFAKIQDILQVENIFSFQILREKNIYQLSLKLITLDEKFIKTGLCENCSTTELLERIQKLYNSIKSDIF